MNNLEWKDHSVKPVVKTFKEAVRLSLLKWEYIVANKGSDEDLKLKVPEVAKLVATCGLCHLCTDENINPFNSCTYQEYNNLKLCPLVIDGISCGNELNKHPWHIWKDNKTKKNAQIVLNLIKAIEI